MSDFIFTILSTAVNEETHEIACQTKCIGELVRCKDCKYSESVPKWKDFELGCMLHREYTTATDFCSQAERRKTQ